MTRQIDDLARMSAMLRDRDLGAVEKIVTQLNAIRSDSAMLEDKLNERRADPTVDAARLTGMDMQWMAEIERRMLRLRQQEAVLRVAHEAALSQARKSFGRAEVAVRLQSIKPTV